MTITPKDYGVVAIWAQGMPRLELARQAMPWRRFRNPARPHLLGTRAGGSVTIIYPPVSRPATGGNLVFSLFERASVPNRLRGC